MSPQPSETPPFKVRWHEVTWYSKLGAIIVFLGIVPALMFYIGTQYQSVLDQQHSVPNVASSTPLLPVKEKAIEEYARYGIEGDPEMQKVATDQLNACLDKAKDPHACVGITLESCTYGRQEPCAYNEEAAWFQIGNVAYEQLLKINVLSVELAKSQNAWKTFAKAECGLVDKMYMAQGEIPGVYHIYTASCWLDQAADRAIALRAHVVDAKPLSNK